MERDRLPVYATMRAVFQCVDLQSLLNPLLAAVAILALYGTARNIWPQSKMNALVAIGLLGSSSQFLLMSMTGYSMPAHLALNTVWLWLYSNPDRRRFFLRLCRRSCLGIASAFLSRALRYTISCSTRLATKMAVEFHLRWRLSHRLRALALLVGSFSIAIRRRRRRQHVSIPNPRMAIIQPMNLLLIIAWSCLATPLLATLGASRWFRQPPILQDATVSCLLTFGFYFFFYLY